ncbi:MAG: NAD(+) diphosphatase [Bacteroidota bacterium]|nr:NAD(+) diphosphatase [Bacteroidota bacterium]
MLHDIGPGIFSNKFVDEKVIKTDDYILAYDGPRILLKKTSEGYEIPRKKDLKPTTDKNHVFLFSLNGDNCFLTNDIIVADAPFVYEDTFALRTLPDKEIAWIGVLGHQLFTWYENHQFCGKCGHKNQRKTEERALICSHCHTVVYPQISPAIIVAITCGDRILLARGKNFRSNFYSLVAGFVEVGESLEETVAREVKEEVGIDVKNIRYYKSQPWPFSSSMMIGYIAEADDSQPIKIDPNEIIDAEWFQRGSLPVHPTNVSIAGEMIELFEAGKL